MIDQDLLALKLVLSALARSAISFRGWILFVNLGIVSVLTMTVATWLFLMIVP